MVLLRSFRKNRLRFAFEAAEPKLAPQESAAGESRGSVQRGSRCPAPASSQT